MPLYEFGKEFKAVKKSLAKGDYAKALKALTALESKGVEGAKDFKVGVEGMVTGSVAALQSALDKGDFLAVLDGVAKYSKGFKGLDAEKELIALKKAVAAHPQSKTVLKGQRALAKALKGELHKKKDLQKALDATKKLQKSYAGTIVADQAKAAEADLRKKLQALNRR